MCKVVNKSQNALLMEYQHDLRDCLGSDTNPGRSWKRSAKRIKTGRQTYLRPKKDEKKMVLRLSIETLWTKDLENTQRKDENRKLDPLGWSFLESRAWVFISSTVLSFAYIRDNSSSNCQVQAKISKDQTLIFFISRCVMPLFLE